MKAFQRTGATITEESLVKRAHMAWNRMKHQNPDVKPPSFSKGWISNVKKSLNITQRAVSGESASVPVEALELMPAIREICGEYSQKDIFNMDESALYYKLGPSKTLGSKPVSGPKKSKQRLAMVLCCNAHATGSFDTEDDNNGPQDDDAHGEPDFEVQKITTDLQNMLAQKQINRFFTLDYFSGPTDEQNEAKNLENEANEKAADEELMKQAQQYSGILNAEDIGEDGKIVREYFNDINTLIKSVLGTISFAKCPREKQQIMLEIIKKKH